MRVPSRSTSAAPTTRAAASSMKRLRLSEANMPGRSLRSNASGGAAFRFKIEPMKTEANLGTPGAKEMRELVAALTPAERRTLKDPDFITEDEADLIMSDRSLKEPGKSISLDEL